MSKSAYIETDAPMQSEIIVERREHVGIIYVDPNGYGSAIAHAFTMAGDYIAIEDTDRPVIIEFTAFGHTYRATKDVEYQ